MHPLRQAIWGHIWKRTVEKNQTNAASVTLHLLGQAIWGDIRKYTVEKSPTNATNVTLSLLRQAIWGHIWKRRVEKSQTNATNVIMQHLRQAIWGDIWKHTVEKSQTNATNATMHPLMQALWRPILKYTVEKSPTNATCVIMPALIQVLWGDMWKDTLDKSQTNATCVILHLLPQAVWRPIWKCTLEKSETVQFGILRFKQFENTFGKTQVRKEDQSDAFLIIYDILLSILIYLSFLLWLTDRLFRPQYSSLEAGGAREELEMLSLQSNNHRSALHFPWVLNFATVLKSFLQWLHVVCCFLCYHIQLSFKFFLTDCASQMGLPVTLETLLSCQHLIACWTNAWFAVLDLDVKHQFILRHTF